MFRHSFLWASFASFLCAGCVNFNHGSNYILVAAVGSQVKVYLFSPRDGTLTAGSGTPVAVSGTAQNIALHPDGTSLYVADNTNFSFKQYLINGKTLALTLNSAKNYVNQTGGLCLNTSGSLAYVFAKSGGVTDESDVYLINSNGSFGSITTSLGAGYYCGWMSNPSNYVLYSDGALGLYQVNSSGSNAQLSTVGSGGGGNFIDFALNSANTYALALDDVGATDVIRVTNTLTTVSSPVAPAGAVSVERLGDSFFIATGAQNTIAAYTMSSSGVMSAQKVNTVTGNPNAMAADSTGTYLAVNRPTLNSGTTTIYTSSSGTLTAVASVVTGNATQVLLGTVYYR